MKRAYQMYGAALILLYAAAAWSGWEMGAARSGQRLPASVRQAPGGYRTYGYWRGGK